MKAGGDEMELKKEKYINKEEDEEVRDWGLEDAGQADLAKLIKSSPKRKIKDEESSQMTSINEIPRLRAALEHRSQIGHDGRSRHVGQPQRLPSAGSVHSNVKTEHQPVKSESRDEDPSHVREGFSNLQRASGHAGWQSNVGRGSGPLGFGESPFGRGNGYGRGSNAYGSYRGGCDSHTRGGHTGYNRGGQHGYTPPDPFQPPQAQGQMVLEDFISVMRHEALERIVGMVVAPPSASSPAPGGCFASGGPASGGPASGGPRQQTRAQQSGSRSQINSGASRNNDAHGEDLEAKVAKKAATKKAKNQRRRAKIRARKAAEKEGKGKERMGMGMGTR